MLPEEFVVCVTGAASGIGRATVALLAEQGAALVLVDRDEVSLAALDGELSSSTCRIAITGDLAQPDVATRVLRSAIERFGRLDGVVFAAGANGQGPLSEATADDLHAAIQDNVLSHFFLSQAVLNRHKSGAVEELRCALVYIVSKAAVAPSTGFGMYPIAKAAELQLARLVALEGGKYGVRANVINPGAVLTGSKFWGASLIESKAHGHGIEPEQLERYYADRTLLRTRVDTNDVARTAVFLLSPWSRATTGAVVAVDGGLPVSFGR